MMAMSGSFLGKCLLCGGAACVYRRRVVQVEPAARLEDLARYVVTDQARQQGRCVERGSQIDAGVVAVQFQHMDQFLRTHVAGRTGRIRTSADTAKRGIE